MAVTGPITMKLLQIAEIPRELSASVSVEAAGYLNRKTGFHISDEWGQLP
jgi:hypothetical protein